MAPEALSADSRPIDDADQRIVHEALEAAAVDRSIVAGARGIVSPSELIYQANEALSDWRAEVPEEYRSWRSYYDQLQKTEGGLRKTYLSYYRELQRGRQGKGLAELLTRIRGRIIRLFTAPSWPMEKADQAVVSDPERAAAYKREEAVRALLQQSVLERCALPAIRTALNSKLKEDTTNSVLGSADMGAGLSQLLPVGFEVPSLPRIRVANLINTLSTASIGIAGPRGCGKTTLLEHFTGRRRLQRESEYVAIFLPAPVKYDASEFTLHVAASLSRMILRSANQLLPSIEQPYRDESDDDTVLRRSVIRLALIGIGATAGFLVLFGTATYVTREAAWFDMRTMDNLRSLTATSAIYLLFRTLFNIVVDPLRALMASKRPSTSSIYIRLARATLAIRYAALLGVIYVEYAQFSGRTVIPNSLVLLAGIALGLGLIYVFGQTSQMDGWDTRPLIVTELYRDYQNSVRQASLSPAVKSARELLGRILLQESRSSGSSTRVGTSNPFKVPISFDSTTSSERTVSNNPLSRPEAVAAIRELLGQVGRTRKVVIAVDELDKIDSTQSAAQFIDDVKALFGVPNCYFLVSVSLDAMADFERRGLPFRNSFDSAFDEIVTLEHFSFESSKILLRSRVIAVPLRFIALCHALSGGLPRDLLRVARHLYDLPLPINLDFAAAVLVDIELRTKIKLFASSTHRSRDSTWSSLIAVWTDRAILTTDRFDSLLDSAEELDTLIDASAEHLAAGHERDWELLKLGFEMTSFIYYCATIIETCNKGQQDSIGEDTTVDTLVKLAEVRKSFADNPSIAWSKLELLRGAQGWRTLGMRNWSLRTTESGPKGIH